jgi:Sugar-transfer associated ATP-grasp
MAGSAALMLASHGMPVLESKKLSLAFDLQETAGAVCRATGKSTGEQAEEIRRLGIGIGRLTAQEYYYYRLFDDARYGSAAKARFLGYAAQRAILGRCIARRWRGIAQDKILFQVLMQAYGFPVPRVVALYHPLRAVPGAVALRNATDVAAFLRGSTYPLFGKPVVGMFSLGCIRLEAYEGARDALRLHNNTRVGVAELVGELARYARRGYMFQEVKHPVEPIRRVCGDRIACARVVVLADYAQPEIFRTLLKVPVGPHAADNFWRPGNLLAAVAADTGTLKRVVCGVALGQREVVSHPDTGEPLVGLRLPHWPQMVELVLAAARVLAGLSMPAWDIALCPEGPVILEVNVGGDFNLPQLADARGLLDQRFRRFLHRTGYLR